MPFEYAIKRQRRKTMALHVLEDASVEVRVPTWLAKRDIEKFIHERAAWVLDQQQKRLVTLKSKPAYHSGELHYFLDQAYVLQIKKGLKKKVQCQDQHIVITSPLTEDAALIKKLLVEWYRAQAKIHFQQRLAYYFPRLPINKALPQLKIRHMKRRWGSCSSLGVVTFNLDLMKYPQACIDYVVVHELCHMLEMNHSRQFYYYLATVFPDWRQRELLLERLARERSH